MQIFYFILGFIVLIKGADLLVEGAASIAKRHGVSDMVVGLSILAFGTSTPELVVSFLASAAGKSDLAIGNVLGSNVANVLIVCGVAAIFGRIKVNRITMRLDYPISLLAVGLLLILAMSGTSQTLTGLDGIILIAAFGLFLVRLFWEARKGNISGEEEVPTVSMSQPRAWLQIVFGLGGLVLGGNWIVDGATVLASWLGMSEALIGLTVVAVGTSLPELATSAVAARKGKADLALGNALGSNIFNILWILGVSSLVRPLTFSPMSIQDSLAVVVATLIMGALLLFSPKGELGRGRGIILLSFYGLYLVGLVLREGNLV